MLHQDTRLLELPRKQQILFVLEAKYKKVGVFK